MGEGSDFIFGGPYCGTKEHLDWQAKNNMLRKGEIQQVHIPARVKRCVTHHSCECIIWQRDILQGTLAATISALSSKDITLDDVAGIVDFLRDRKKLTEFSLEEKD